MNLADYTFRKQIGLHHSRASAIDNSHTHNSARSAHTNSAVGRKSLHVQMIKTEDIGPPPWGLSPLGNEVLGVIIRQDNIEHRRLVHSFILKSLYRINTREEWRMSALLDCTTFISFFFLFSALVRLAAWVALSPRVSRNSRLMVRDSWSQTSRLGPARQNVDAQGGGNQINNSRPGRFNVDTMMTKDKQGCGQQWRTQPIALPPSLPSSVNCCLATGFTLTGLQAAVCCLWPHLGGIRLLFAIRVERFWQLLPFINEF